MRFKEIKLNKRIQDAIKKAGYENMTPIQEQAIPEVISGQDMIACAQTGTGKTAAFALPILDKLCSDQTRTPRALILTPTRELAQQIFDNFKKYGRYLKLRTACIYGGASQYMQIKKLNQGYDILIATPGRLMDFTDRGIVNLENIEIFVLDEADRMLDMGFIPDVRKIAGMIPETHQTLMFSATMPRQIENLANDLLNNPVDVRVAETSSPAETVEQRICFVERDNKPDLLINYLGRDDVKKSIIFTRTKYGADKLVKYLVKQGIETKAIHGDKSQGQRKDALDRFRVGKIKVLVATDVAARGIDIPKITHVFNYDLPEEAESYIHRIGRAGRAGETGEAISFCSRDELGALYDIEILIKREISEEETEWTIEVTRLEKHKSSRNNKSRGNNKGKQKFRSNKTGNRKSKDFTKNTDSKGKKSQKFEMNMRGELVEVKKNNFRKFSKSKNSKRFS